MKLLRGLQFSVSIVYSIASSFMERATDFIGNVILDFTHITMLSSGRKYLKYEYRKEFYRYIPEEVIEYII